jgi:hypothetical protein
MDGVIKDYVCEGGVSYNDGREKRLWNSVPASVLLRKNLKNGVSARSITKITLLTFQRNILPPTSGLQMDINTDYIRKVASF